MLLGGFLAGSIVVSAAFAQAPKTSAAQAPAVSTNASARHKVSPYINKGSSPQAAEFYASNWGVDSFSVKMVESGQMVRFSYRVVDPVKAKPLSDKKAAPALIDAKARVKLVVPRMEKVGDLRQSTAPEAGKAYWMVFSNKGRVVKPGDRVSVTIGRFHVDQLLVE